MELWRLFICTLVKRVYIRVGTLTSKYPRTKYTLDLKIYVLLLWREIHEFQQRFVDVAPPREEKAQNPHYNQHQPKFVQRHMTNGRTTHWARGCFSYKAPNLVLRPHNVPDRRPNLWHGHCSSLNYFTALESLFYLGFIFWVNFEINRPLYLVPSKAPNDGKQK